MALPLIFEIERAALEPASRSRFDFLYVAKAKKDRVVAESPGF
jgi:hypothetical protein